MAPPPHRGRYPSRRTPKGTLYTHADPRAAGWRAEVYRADFGAVTYRVCRPDNPSPSWSSASSLDQAWERAHIILSHAIMASARRESLNAEARRKHPVVCPTCRAAIGLPCKSASGNKLPDHHVGRKRLAASQPAPHPRAHRPLAVSAR